MADTVPNAAPMQTADYVLGYRAGLDAGFDQGLIASSGGYRGEPSNARKVAAWFVLSAGLAGAAGVLLTSRKDGVGLGTTVIVGSSILTALITSLQVITSGGRRL
jgi:hypothetical protein